MRRALPRLQPSRWTSKRSGRASRRALSVAAVAALLIGALLAWTIPALAGTGRVPALNAAARTGTGRARSATTVAHVATTPRRGTSTQTTPKKHKKTVRTVDTTGLWNVPFNISGAVDSDLIAPVLAVSSSGSFTVGSGKTDEDAPNTARAILFSGGAHDAVAAPQKLSDIQQALATGYLGSRLVLITGTGPGADACCSVASTAHGTDLAGSQQLTDALEGTTTGALIPVSGGMLAAVDNQSGITVARSDTEANFSTSEQLVGSDPTPPLMAATALADGGALVAWTAPASGAVQTVTGTTTTPGSTSTTAQGYDQPSNQLIKFAVAGASGLPGAPRLAVRVPAGREIDGLAVTQHRNGATLLWTESWYSGSRYLSEVFWTDVVNAQIHPGPLSAASSSAVTVSVASSQDGREVATWQACAISAGTCQVQAALRPHGDAWGAVRTLGDVDATSFPVAAESAAGESLVGWIDNGLVRAASAGPGAVSFHPSVMVARAAADSDLTLTFGAAKRAVAAWIQGTVNEKLVGARFTP